MGYSWEDDSKGPEESGGHDYRSAREAYAGSSSGSRSGRSSSSDSSSRSERDSSSSRSSGSRSKRADHDFSSARGKTPHPSGRPEVAVKTESTHPVVVCVDHTGSCETEVKMILEKLPLLGKEVERYMPEHAICFSLIGDTTSDSYPFQVRDFDRGEALDEHIKALFPEGDGGDEPESYDLAAYYFANHCEMPNATKPIFIWVLDSTTREELRKEHVKKYIGDDVQSNSNLDSIELLKDLTKKFNVWVILKGSDRFWTKIYGSQAIVPMEDPRDIVELIIGIIAAEAGKFEDFEKRSSDRHSDRPDRVSRVMDSMRSAKMKSKAAESEGDGHSMRSGTSGIGSSAKSTKSMKSTKLV